MLNAVSNDTLAYERLVRFYDAFRHISSNRGPTLMSSKIITLDIRLVSRMWQALSKLRFLY
jgi:hypothetical protein